MEAKRAYMCKERIVDLEFKISRLGLLGKAYYDLVQIKLRRHRNQISIARTQNMLLHAALDTLRHKARIARKNLGDLESLWKTVASLRVTYDHQRKLVFSRQKKLEAQVTDTHSADLECAGVLDPNTPDSVRIRGLEAMLNAIRLKTKDVQILMRHYEATLKPMKDEYASYSAKLEAVQNILNIKIVECEKLINCHHDAIRARDAAKKELEELIGTLFGKDGRDLVSPELQKKILAAIKKIKDVMEVRSMREMYHQFILQEKQSAYLESIYVELKRTVDQLKNDYPPRRKSTMQPHAVRSMIEGTKVMVRRQSSRRGSIPLLQMLEGTQKLVERLHEGNVTMPTEEGKMKDVLTKCQERMSNLMQAVHRKLKHMQKEAHRKAKEDAEATGQAYVREARFADLDAEDDARKAAKEKRAAEIRREIAAREAETRRKEEETLAAREERRAQVRAEMGKIREKSRKEAEAQAEAIRKWQKENEPARSSKSLASSSAGAPRGKSLKTAGSMKHAVERSGHAPGSGSLPKPGHKSPETVSSSERAAELDAKAENDRAKEVQAPTGEKKVEPPPTAEKGESPDAGLPSSPPSEPKEEVRTGAAPSSTEPQVQPAVAPSSPEQATKMGPQARSSRVRVTFTATSGEAGELRVHLQEPPSMAEQGESPDEAGPSSSPSEAKEEVRTAAAPSSTEPLVQPAVAPSSPEQVAEMGAQTRSSRIGVTFTATGAEAGELRVHLQEPPSMAEQGEPPDVAGPSSSPSEAKEEVRTAAAPSSTEPQVQPAVAPSSQAQAAERGPHARSSQVRVTFTATGAEGGELRVQLAALATTEDEARLAEGATTAVTVPSTPEAQTSEEGTKQPEAQPPPRSSSSQHGAIEENLPEE